MKKLISVALALVLVFTLTVSVAALGSPTAKSYYAITVTTEPADGSFGTASASTNQVQKGTNGTVKLEATEGAGYFTLWIIKGKYDVVACEEGYEDTPEEALWLEIRPRSDIQAIANFRVEENFLNMTVSTVGHGSASVSPASVGVGSGELVTFTAVDGLETFSGWVLECKYDIVEGSLNSRTLVIRPYTDVHATATFGGATVSANTGTKNTSSSSPKTGDPLFIVIGLAVLALGTGALAVKKIKE